MPELKVSILFELDGQPVANSPLVRRYNVSENVGPGMTLILAPDNDSVTYHPIVAATMPELQALFLTTDNPTNVKLNLNTPIPLDAGGLILILGTSLVQGTPSQNCELNNPAATAGVSATLDLFVAGT